MPATVFDCEPAKVTGYGERGPEGTFDDVRPGWRGLLRRRQVRLLPRLLLKTRFTQLILQFVVDCRFSGLVFEFLTRAAINLRL